MQTRLLSLPALLFLFTLSASSQHIKAFYVGHSLSDQLPDMVKSLSDDHGGASFDWVYQSIPGAALRWQWQRKDADDYSPNPPHYAGFYHTTPGLPRGDFDVPALTEAVPRYWNIIDETRQYADSFVVYALRNNPDIRIFLYEDWHCLRSGTPTGCDYDIDAAPWRRRLTDDMAMWESVVDTLNARHALRHSVCLIPAGQAPAALYDSIQAGVVPGIHSIDDVFSDDIHLTDVGKRFVACVHFAMIHGRSPVGLTRQLHVWWGGEFQPPSAELALKFQHIAWDSVLRYPASCLDSGVTSTSSPPFAGNDIFLFPNPAQDMLYVGYAGQDRTVEIYNTLGAYAC